MGSPTFVLNLTFHPVQRTFLASTNDPYIKIWGRIPVSVLYSTPLPPDPDVACIQVKKK